MGRGGGKGEPAGEKEEEKKPSNPCAARGGGRGRLRRARPLSTPGCGAARRGAGGRSARLRAQLCCEPLPIQPGVWRRNSLQKQLN